MSRYFIAWFPMLMIAVANGIARDFLYKPFAGDLLAHQISTLTLILLLAAYIRWAIGKLTPASGGQALGVGVLWGVLTLAFEFGFGRYTGKTWTELLADCNVLNGRVWVLVPLWMGIAPWLFYNFRRPSSLYGLPDGHHTGGA